MKKKIVVVPSSQWQLSLIKFLKKKNFFVYSLDDNDLAIGHNYSNKRLEIKTSEKKKLNYFLKKNNLEIISCCSDFGEKICFKKQKKNTRLFNKYYQREVQKKIGLITPYFQKNILKYKKETKNKNFIIKPINGSGSKDISLIKNFSKSIYKKGYLFEEFIEGKEYSVDGFFYKKKLYLYGIMEKKKVNNSISVSYILRSKNLNKEIRQKIKFILETLFNKMNYPNGPIHSELILNKNNIPFLVESHPREVGFDVYYRLLKHVTGLNLYENTIKARLNQNISFTDLVSKNKYKYFCARMIPINRSGVIKNIKFKKIKKNKDILIFKKIFVKKNDKVKFNNIDSSRLGYIFCLSNKNKNLEEFSKKILNNSLVVNYN